MEQDMLGDVRAWTSSGTSLSATGAQDVDIWVDITVSITQGKDVDIFGSLSSLPALCNRRTS